MQPDALYAYAVLPDAAALPACEASILPGAALRLVTGGGCAVLASPVPRALFQAGPECRMADPDWLAERAAAHHAVVAACAATGPALPLAFGALFSDAAPLTDWILPRAAALRAGLAAVSGCAEWSLRIEEDVAAHAAWLDAHDPALREIAQRIEASAAGTAFLLGRRRMQLRAEVRSARMDALSRRLRDRLQAHARALPAELTALVAADRTPALHAEVAELGEELAASGVTLRLAGPWPAYASARAALQHG